MHTKFFAPLISAFSIGMIASLPSSARAEQPDEQTLGATAAIRSFAAPTSADATKDWTRDGLWLVQEPDEPASPRIMSAVTGPKYDVTSVAGAFTSIVEIGGIVLRGQPNFETLDAWRSFDGRDMRTALVDTEIGGVPGVLFVLISNARGSDEFQIYAVETPRDTFREWGGIVRMLVLRDVIPSMGAFPQDRTRQVAASSHAAQIAVYEAALDKLYGELAAQMYAASQAQVLMRMQELNYDLLLSGDITSPAIAD